MNKRITCICFSLLYSAWQTNRLTTPACLTRPPLRATRAACHSPTGPASIILKPTAGLSHAASTCTLRIMSTRTNPSCRLMLSLCTAVNTVSPCQSWSLTYSAHCDPPGADPPTRS
ncbi:hypothetical protein B0T10DRAFT_224739 [Thelonectria olida]|uniref:Secreted protein n=1 Tax=Thelonectria olida TaxID=1576542 RepID=A0A9P8WAR7_9HYPO|nr:hypothetical protein B0T10DRAFT_224739 [Thelonectria olida]